MNDLPIVSTDAYKMLYFAYLSCCLICLSVSFLWSSTFLFHQFFLSPQGKFPTGYLIVLAAFDLFSQPSAVISGR